MLLLQEIELAELQPKASCLWGAVRLDKPICLNLIQQKAARTRHRDRLISKFASMMKLAKSQLLATCPGRLPNGWVVERPKIPLLLSYVTIFW